MLENETLHQMGLDERVQALAEIVKSLLKPLDLEAILQETLETIVTYFGSVQSGMILLSDRSSDSLQPVASQDYEQEHYRSTWRSKAIELGKVCFDRETVTLSPVSSPTNDLPGHGKAQVSSLAAPITTDDDKYGVIILQSVPGEAQFSPQDIPLIETIAKLIALTIDRDRKGNLASANQAKQIAEELHAERMTTLSHELRLPLTAIMGYASALLLDEISWTREKQVEIIGRIVEESESMQAMLKNLLDASLIEAERISIQPQQLDLHRTAREIAEEFQNRTKKHRIFVELPSGFPTILADPKWIKQVLRNLLDNAIKYSPAGGLIVMRGEIRRRDIVLSIADQGIGIPPEDIPTLFEKYYRVKPPSGIRVPGTGLGLPIARTIVEAHGGRIWVESLLGQGTTVSFSLPHSPSHEIYEG